MDYRTLYSTKMLTNYKSIVMQKIAQLALTFFILNFSPFIATAQVAINENNSNPDPSAMLDVSSIDKGLLIPRMDSTARSMIQNPVEGLLVYDESSRSFWYFLEEWTELNQKVNIEFDGKAIIIKQPLFFEEATLPNCNYKCNMNACYDCNALIDLTLIQLVPGRNFR